MAVENRYPMNPPGAVVFHRSARPARLKDKTGKKSLGWAHLLGLFFSLILFFLGWPGYITPSSPRDQLRIKKIEVTSSSPELKQRVESFLLIRILATYCSATLIISA